MFYTYTFYEFLRNMKPLGAANLAESEQIDSCAIAASSSSTVWR